MVICLSTKVNQVEHILLRLNAESDNQRDAETIVRDMVEEYNADAEKNGMKNFVISTTANQEGDDNDSRNEGFSIVIQREVTL